MTDQLARLAEALQDGSPAEVRAITMRAIDALVKVVEAVKADLNRVATMPWCKDSHEETRWTCVPDQLWVDWIHGTHEAIYDALVALDACIKDAIP